MSNTQEKAFDIRIKLTMFDYFRYYFSLFNLKLSGLIVNVISAIVMLVYSVSLVSLIYSVSTTGALDWPTAKGMLLDAVIIALFSTPFARTYLIAFKDAKTHKFLDKYIDVRIAEDKFIVSPESAKIEYSWKKMYKIFDFRHGFALFIDKKDLAFVLPKRCFNSKEQVNFLKQIIEKYKK